MASGGRLPSQPPSPAVRSQPRLGEAACGVPLPQPWWNPWLSGPSPRGPRAACPALGVAPGPQLPRPPLQATTLRVPCDWRGPLDERRLVANLQLALGREARLWRGGQFQVAGPAAGASRDHVHPLPRERTGDAAGFHLRPRPGGAAPWRRGPSPGACHARGTRRQSRAPLAERAPFSAEICHKVQEVVLWLLGLQNIFNFSQTTFNMALTTFSRLLVSVKIRERLLHCVMITSLRLAAKFNEEEELIPRIKDFIKHYGSGYTPGELRRMELAILDRLHWDLYIAVPLDFLTIN
ncbi:cyclin-I2 [Suricata suricatta]|uniref:cyclin-I2 n=1 Tax=Suricata suricatta TaxID=37032 RepID=UPI001155E7E6|nr:cyclin-I2 [Suricata suricatta]